MALIITSGHCLLDRLRRHRLLGWCCVRPATLGTSTCAASSTSSAPVIEVVDDVRDVGDLFRFSPSRRSLLNRHLMLSRMMVTGLVRR